MLLNDFAFIIEDVSTAFKDVQLFGNVIESCCSDCPSVLKLFAIMFKDVLLGWTRVL